MSVRIVDEKPDPSVVKHKVCRSCGVTGGQVVFHGV